MLEFILSCLVFLMVVFLSMDVLRYSFETARANHVVNMAIREVTIGGAEGAARTAAFVGEIEGQATTIGVTAPLNIKICSTNLLHGSTPPCCETSDGTCTNANNPKRLAAGGSSDMVQITINYNFQSLFFNIIGLGDIWPVRAQAIGRNEPF